MFFGIDMEKIVIILVVAALLLGPEKLPRYAELLAKLTVRVRDWLTDARSRVRDEMGEDFDDIEWRKLDPRQYDPRRIIRDALLDDAPVPTPTPVSPVSTSGSPTAVASASVTAATAAASSPVAASAPASTTRVFRGEGPVPFDSEAT
jgi:sec-independent protein translocase protein TatB